MTKEEIETAKKELDCLIKNGYCNKCTDNFGNCLDCIEEQDSIRESINYVIDGLQYENEELKRKNEKQKKILDVVKKQIKETQLKHYQFNGMIIPGDNINRIVKFINGIVFCNDFENKEEYELLKEWLENE